MACFFFLTFPRFTLSQTLGPKGQLEFRMAHRSLGGVHESLFALDFITTFSCFHLSSTRTL